MECAEQQDKKTYNTKDSPVVTDLSTSLAISSLIKGERTGSHVVCYLWSYVLVDLDTWDYVPSGEGTNTSALIHLKISKSGV